MLTKFDFEKLYSEDIPEEFIYPDGKKIRWLDFADNLKNAFEENFIRNKYTSYSLVCFGDISYAENGKLDIEVFLYGLLEHASLPAAGKLNPGYKVVLRLRELDWWDAFFKSLEALHLNETCKEWHEYAEEQFLVYAIKALKKSKDSQNITIYANLEGETADEVCYRTDEIESLDTK